MANVRGNMMWKSGGSNETVKAAILKKLHERHGGKANFISTDPLISMVIPKAIVEDHDVKLLHVVRDAEGFARSFFRLSRSRWKSFIAHNFVPFWQPTVWPMENLFKAHIHRKYEAVWKLKNDWFEQAYSMNPNYQRVEMKALFEGDLLARIVGEHFDVPLEIPQDLLRVRSNESR